jgi:hypothetical protein
MKWLIAAGAIAMLVVATARGPGPIQVEKGKVMVTAAQAIVQGGNPVHAIVDGSSGSLVKYTLLTDDFSPATHSPPMRAEQIVYLMNDVRGGMVASDQAYMYSRAKLAAIEASASQGFAHRARSAPTT